MLELQPENHVVNVMTGYSGEYHSNTFLQYSGSSKSGDGTVQVSTSHFIFSWGNKNNTPSCTHTDTVKEDIYTIQESNRVTNQESKLV